MPSYPVSYPVSFPLTYPVSRALLGGVSKGIRLSASSLQAGSAQGTAIGTLSVTGGTGTYTFTLTDSASSKAQVAGTNGVNLQAGSASASASTFNITVHADNGAGSTFDRTFTLTVWTAVSNSVAPAISGSAVQGAALSVGNGTWTGFPAPTYSYQWKRAGSPIAGATTSTYVVQNADVGSAITCTVTASNGFSNANATTSATPTVTKTTLSYTPVTSATQGAAYIGATPSTSGGTAPYVYSVSASLPSGLSISSSTGVISGTPTTVQTASGLALVAADASGVTDTSASFSIAVATSSVPTAFALTDVPSGRLFQRTKALTTGPVSTAGTYTGGDPNAIELQVRKVSDNTVVKAWTTAAATIGSGSWSATITGVAQGGSYYVEARPSNATGLAQTGSNPFFVGIMILMYGQSNMAFMSSTGASPPSAVAGTSYFDGSNWGAVPAANGVRELLNGVVNTVGVPCAALNGAVPGQTISSLSKGNATGYYTNLMAQIAAVGGDAEFVVWHQGEGDTNGVPTPAATYITRLVQLHSDLASDVGRTTAQLKIAISSLATCTDGTGTDDTWYDIQAALRNAPGSDANIVFSHSNLDAPLAPAQGIHWTGAGYGNSGKRYARTISKLLGTVATVPAFFITAATIVDATTTDVTIVHSTGSDFTPTSGITGFRVSSDNGASWATPSAAVRQAATTIRLTHSSMTTTLDRLIQYDFGKAPDMTGAVVDNGSLNAPLCSTGGTTITAAGSAALPVPTYRATATASGTTTQTIASMSIGAAAARRMLIFTWQMNTTSAFTSMTATPNVGTAKTVTVVQQSSGNGMAGVGYCVLDADADTATTISISASYASNPFNTIVVSCWTVPSANLSSTTPVDSKTVNAGSGTTLSTTLATISGGFMIACAQNGNTSANSGAFTGSTETFVREYNAPASGGQMIAGDASNVATNAASTVAVAFTVNARMAMAVASWR